MREKFILIQVFVLCFIPLKLSAQVKVEAELRPRFEYRYGYKKHPADSSFPAYLVTQRSRLILFVNNERLSSKVSIQDVRTWGDEKLKDDVATIGLYEAWAEWRATDSLSVKVGRQEFIYDNDRFLSNSNWTQRGLTHDALLFKFRYNKWNFHLAAALNEFGEPGFGTDYNNAAVKDNYKTLNFLWAGKKFGDLNMSVVAIFDGFQKPGLKTAIYLRQTYGANLSYPIAGQNLILHGYLQSGKDKSGKKINAWYINPEVALLSVGNFNVTPGLEVFSGQDAKDTTNTRINYFSSLYGSGHAFNGHMDYFTDFPKNTKNAGLVDGYLKLTGKITKILILKVDCHYFSLQNNYLNKKIVIDKYLGSEIDLNFKYDFAKEFSLQGGFSMMFAGSSMEIINGGNKDRIGKWGWLMCTFRPSFLNNK